MFFIAGVTGKTGGAAARRLLEDGFNVSTLVRDPQKALEWSRQGVRVHQGDLNNARDVAAALEGVDGAFLMLPPTITPAPGHPEARATIASFGEALRIAPPPLLVMLSSFGSERTSGLGNITSTHLMEQVLDDLAMPTAILRPGSFMENYLYGLHQAEASGFVDFFLTPTDRKVPMTATADIGAEIARRLREEWEGRRIVEIGSRFSPDDLAQAIGKVVGHTVIARSIPREEWASTLESMGMPAGSTDSIEELNDGINSGWIDHGVIGTEPVAGTTTPDKFFATMRK